MFDAICKYITFLYVFANKKVVLLYFKQLQLRLRKVPVKKSSSLKINLQCYICYVFILIFYEILAFAIRSILLRY